MTALTLPWGRPGAGTAAAGPVAPVRPREGTPSSKTVAAASSSEPVVVDDRDLILRAQKGDEEAFAGLVERYKKRAYWVAYNLVNDEDEAKDVSQEAFIRVF